MEKKKTEVFIFKTKEPDRENLRYLARRMRCSGSAVCRLLIAQAASALQREEGKNAR